MRSPQTTQFINLQVQGVQAAQGQFDRLSSSLNRYSRNLQKSSTATQKQKKELDYFSDQGLANIQTGLLQVTTFAMNLNQKLDNLFDKMTNRFSTAEEAVTQLKITMGLVGERTSANKALYKQFDDSIKIINRLAGTTKFTKVEVTDAFNSLIKGGLDSAEAIGLLAPMLKFVTASAGQIDLVTGAEIARKTYTTLGGELSNVEDNLNRLLRATQKTPLSFEHLNSFLTGIRDTAKTFGTSNQMEANIIALGAAMASAGIDGREAGGVVKQFASSISGMYRQLDYARAKNAKGNGRVRIKKKYILELLGIDKESLSDSNLRKIMGDPFTKINLLRDRYAKTFFVKKDGSFRGPSEMLGTIVDSYKRLVDSKRPALAKTILSGAFGKVVGKQMLSAIEGIVEQNEKRGIGSYGEFVDMLDKHNDDISKAMKMTLKDLKSRAAVLESAYDALFQGIMAHDVYGKEALETHTSVVNAANDLIKTNKSVAVSISAFGRTAQFLTSIMTNLGFALVASATFAIGLRYTAKSTGVAVATLSSTFGAFYKTFLAPTLRVLLLFGGGLVSVGLLAVAFARSMSDAGTVADGFKETLVSIRDQVKSLAGLFKLSTADRFSKNSIRKIVDRFKYLRSEINKRI